jgi:PKD repeat protein
MRSLVARRDFLGLISFLKLFKFQGVKITVAVISAFSNDNGNVIISTLGTKAAPGSKLTAFSVAWGDGLFTNGSGKPSDKVNHVYAKSGSYRVSLKVYDSKGRFSESSMGMIVQINSGTNPPSSIVASLELASTFKCISVRVPISSDISGIAECLIEFKLTSSGTWSEGLFPYYDRRVTVNGNPNPYVNQFRGSIFGLTAGTSYDVRVTLIQGSDILVLQTTITTLSTSIPLGGTEYYLDPTGANGTGTSGNPWNNFASAQAVIQPGDTLHLRPGANSALTWTVSGLENAWIKIIGDDRDTCLINGGAVDNALLIDANYVKFENIRCKQPLHSTIVINTNRHHVWLENYYVEDVASTPTYGDGAVNIGSGTHHIYIFNGFCFAPSITTYFSPRFDEPIGGIQIGGASDILGTFVIAGNTVDGKFRDGVLSLSETFGNGFLYNTDIYQNTFSQIGDDSLQPEGDSSNLRMWENDITVGGFSFLATQSSFIGPVYFLRNKCKQGNTGVAGTGFKSVFSAATYFMHNSVLGTSLPHDLVVNGGSVGHYFRNNIFDSNGAANPFYSSVGDLDYNLYRRSTSSVLFSDWNGVLFANYENVGPGSDFFLATGNEEHGVEGDPLWTSLTALTITTTSPAYRKGVVIPNINSLDSAWPYQGVAPDIGQYIVP